MLNAELKTMSNDTHSKTSPPVHRSALRVQRLGVRRLLVRGPNWIGDAVMCEPALSTLRGLFPAAEITALLKPSIAELLHGHPALDRVLVYEGQGRHAGWGGKWRLARTLRGHRFDLAVLFQNAFEAALLAFLAGIPRRYGYATDGRSLLLTDPVGVAEHIKTAHQVHYYLGLLRPLGWEGKPAPPRLYLSGEEERQIALRLAEAGVHSTDFLIGLNPGSTYGGAKRWLPERFAEGADLLAREIRHRTGRESRILVVGAPGEEALGRSLADRMGTPPLLWAGTTTIRELMAVIKRCGLFLTNDTGPMHIAAAFGVPLVAVFGPTDPRTTAPFGNGHALIRHPVECSPCLLRECPIDHRCMTHVTVDEVVGAAQRLLETVNGERGTRNEQRQQADPEHSAFSVQRSALHGVVVFLDRDGTLNRDSGYIKSEEELVLLPGTVEAVAQLNRAGAKVVLITNQSGVARGMLTRATLDAIHARLCTLLAEGGASLDGIYYCPHHPEDGCACRKPGTGLVEQAVANLGLDLSRAYVVGDQVRDVALARRIGARSVLVTTGPANPDAVDPVNAEGWPPDRVAEGLPEAAGWILADAASRQRSVASRQVRLAEG